MSEKAPQQILPTLIRMGSAACALGQRVKIESGIVRQGIGLQVGPQVFDGIELGSVRRQVKAQAVLTSLFDTIPVDRDGKATVTLDVWKMLSLVGGTPVEQGALGLVGSGGVIWSHSRGVVCFSDSRASVIFAAAKFHGAPPMCGNGHPLTPDNVCVDASAGRWRRRQCGRERAAAFRDRRRRAA